MATLGEVALMAGVSTKTVSRVINGHPNISAKTQRNVEIALEALSYFPVTLQRFDGPHNAANIGMLVSDPSGGYQSRVTHSMLEACKKHGCFLAVELFDHESSKWRDNMLAFLDRTKVQSVILVPPMCDSSDIHALLHVRNIRFVLISPSRAVSSASSIAMDDRLAAYEMTKHLIQLGHRKIGHIGGNPDHVATLLRRQGFLEALANAGLGPPEDGYLETGHFHFKDALDCADRMLGLADRPTAIFAANDEMATAVVTTAHRLGIKVPEQLSVAGFDNVSISQTTWPELTTIAQPFDAIASLAVEILVNGRSGLSNQSQTFVLPHTLLARGSSTHVEKSRFG